MDISQDVTRSFSGAPWETKVGYCRAIRAGNAIYVTGTAAVEPNGTPYAPGEAKAQTRRCLEIIDKALHDLCAEALVVRTRIFVTDIEKWEEIGAAHKDWFKGQPPATTMVEVKRLISPEFLVEIEADAIVTN